MDDEFTIDELLGPMTPDLAARVEASQQSMPAMTPEELEVGRARARARRKYAGRLQELDRRDADSPLLAKLRAEHQALERAINTAFADNPEIMERPDSPSRRLAIAVIAARAERGWSRRELAEHAGTSPRQIARLESGDCDPRMSTLVAVSRALGLELTFGSRNIARRLATDGIPVDDAP